MFGSTYTRKTTISTIKPISQKKMKLQLMQIISKNTDFDHIMDQQVEATCI